MIRVAVILGCASVAAACGGSSSETPFPQPPLERSLQARHDAVLEGEQEQPGAESKASVDVSPKAPLKIQSTK